MNSLKTLPLTFLTEEELETIHGTRGPLLVFLASLPFTAQVHWHYQDAKGTVSGNLAGASSGVFGKHAGTKALGSISLGGSLNIQRAGYSLDVSGNLRVPQGRGPLAASQVGG